MAKAWPAIDVRVSAPRGQADLGSDTAELAMAAADDYAPTAVEQRDGVLRIFFANAANRTRALVAMSQHFDVTTADVDDEDWARRSQLDLEPVTVGRVVIYPAPPGHPARPVEPVSRDQIRIVIPPSMGFGTGHHATTRLCLAVLQSIDLRDRFVLDVGTGSGVLAIAAVKLGAAGALGTDNDADAIQAATENLAFNRVTNVEFAVRDVMADSLPSADVLVANLTGAVIVRAAERLLQALRPGGTLILSGILDTERDDVRRAYANRELINVVQEDEWLALTLRLG